MYSPNMGPVLPSVDVPLYSAQLEQNHIIFKSNYKLKPSGVSHDIMHTPLCCSIVYTDD